MVGAKEHNLQNISVEIPRDEMVVVTGLSGSGKSTLVFDIVYAEGQRRYIDSLSSYSRQFIKIMARPNVDLLTGLPPTVAIEQRMSRGGRNSTVATVTEISHYLRLLYAKTGVQHWMVLHRLSDLDAAGDAGTRQQALAKGLLAETGTVVVYRQHSDEARRASTILGLSETEAHRIAHYPQGVALWRIGGRSYEVRHVRSARERQLTATDEAMAHRQAPSVS